MDPKISLSNDDRNSNPEAKTKPNEVVCDEKAVNDAVNKVTKDEDINDAVDTICEVVCDEIAVSDVVNKVIKVEKDEGINDAVDTICEVVCDEIAVNDAVNKVRKTVYGEEARDDVADIGKKRKFSEISHTQLSSPNSSMSSSSSPGSWATSPSRNNSQSNHQQQEQQPTCRFCYRTGHYSSDCYSLTKDAPVPCTTCDTLCVLKTAKNTLGKLEKKFWSCPAQGCDYFVCWENWVPIRTDPRHGWSWSWPRLRY